MGDVRFLPALQRIQAAADRAREIREVDDEGIVEALAAASEIHEPLLANVLATEALNRLRRGRAALRHVAEGILLLNADEVVTYANPAAARLLDSASLVGEPFHGTIHDSPHHEGGLAACPILRAAREAPASLLDASFRRGGEAFPVALTFAPVVEDARLEGAVAAFHDITDRRRMEQAARESEARFRALAEAAPDPLLIHHNGRILEMNPAAERAFGIATSRARGASLLSLVTFRSQGELLSAVLQSRVEPFRIECRGAGGTTFPSEAHSRPIPYAGLACEVLALRDLSDADRARDLAEELRACYDVVAERHPHLVFLLDDAGRLLAINGASERELQRSRHDWLGETFHDLVAPRDLPRALAAFAAAVDGEAQQVDLHVLDVHGRERPMCIEAVPIRVRGTLRCVACVARPLGPQENDAPGAQ